MVVLSPEQNDGETTPLDELKEQLDALRGQLDTQTQQARKLQATKDREVAGVQAQLTLMEETNAALTDQLLNLPELDEATKASFRMSQLVTENTKLKQANEQANRLQQTAGYWRESLGVPDDVFAFATTTEEVNQAATDWAKQQMNKPAPAPDPAREAAQAAAQAGGLDVSMSPGQAPSELDAISAEHQRTLTEIRAPAFKGDRAAAFMKAAREQESKLRQTST